MEGKRRDQTLEGLSVGHGEDLESTSRPGWEWVWAGGWGQPDSRGAWKVEAAGGEAKEGETMREGTPGPQGPVEVVC